MSSPSASPTPQHGPGIVAYSSPTTATTHTTATTTTTTSGTSTTTQNINTTTDQSHGNPAIHIKREKSKSKHKRKDKDKDKDKHLTIDGNPYHTKVSLKRSRSPIKLLRNIKSYLHVHKQRHSGGLGNHSSGNGGTFQHGFSHNIMNNNSLAPPRTSYDGGAGAGQYRSASLPSSLILSAQLALDDAQLRLSKERQPSEALSPEKQVLLLQVMSYFQHAGHRADEETAEYLLSSYQWNIEQTMQYCQDLVQAVQGTLTPVQQETKLSGAVNDQMTSCYIAFEGLLNVNLDAESDTESDGSSEAVNDPRKDEVKEETLLHTHLLQTWLRMFVNQLRSGQLIQAHVIKELRQHLYSCGWNCPGPLDPPGSSRQEDASELFMFLTEKLHLPYLPLEQRLLHGARVSVDDDKVITERMLQISIPTPESQDGSQTSPTITKLESALSNLFSSKAPTNGRSENDSLNEILSLEKLLAQHFYDNTLTGIRRNVSSGTGAPLSPGVEVPVSAWQVLELLPFYSSSNEQGGIIHASQSQYPADVVILPLILKRYSFGTDMQARRINTPIDIPRRIDFSRFVNRQTSNVPSTSTTPPPPPPPQEDLDISSSTLTVSSELSTSSTCESTELENLPTTSAVSSVRNHSTINIDTHVQRIREYSMSLLQVADSPQTPITPPPQYTPAAYGNKEFQYLSDEKKGWSPRPMEDVFGGDYMDCGPPKVKYILELKSVVCHLGTRLNSGHYRSYVADTVGRETPASSSLPQDEVKGGTTPHPLGFQEPNWLRHDDLDYSGQRVQLISRNSPEDMDMEADWARNGYILFYELQTIQC